MSTTASRSGLSGVQVLRDVTGGFPAATVRSELLIVDLELRLRTHHSRLPPALRMSWFCHASAITGSHP